MSPIALDPSPSPNSSARAPASTQASSIYAPLPPAAVDPTAARRPVEPITVDSPNLKYTDEALFAQYTFHSTEVKRDGERFTVKPVEKNFELRTGRKVPKTGCVLAVSWCRRPRLRHPAHRFFPPQSHARRLGW